MIVLAALLVLSGILRYAEAQRTAQALTPGARLSYVPTEMCPWERQWREEHVGTIENREYRYLYRFAVQSGSGDFQLKVLDARVYGFAGGELRELKGQFFAYDLSKGVLPLGYESGVEFSDQVVNGWLNPLPAQGQQLELVMVLDQYPDDLDQTDQFLLELTYQPAGFAASLLPDGDTAPRTVRLWSE